MKELIAQFKNKKVLIIGDVMIDAYLWGKVDRQSPEAPVPILDVEKKENRLGGAANVALNIKSLGATPILLGMLGDDYNTPLFHNLMEAAGLDSTYLITDPKRPTTVKTRIIKGSEHLLRCDIEWCKPIERKLVEQLQHKLRQALAAKPDVVILQDYNKGLLTKEVIELVLDACREANIAVAVDPKRENFFVYKGVTLFKPNLRELKDALAMDILPDMESLNLAAQKLSEQLQQKQLLLTLSSHGVFYSTDGKGELIPAHPRNIVDVSGAGDTVISVAALALACGADLADVAAISNLAGGLVCEQPGVVPITIEMLEKGINAIS